MTHNICIYPKLEEDEVGVSFAAVIDRLKIEVSGRHAAMSGSLGTVLVFV
ncbi:MAG: hypothetical protein KZQ77_17835 [Candidatus Thiodiazotropha sp. (ex Notomyrtea botanica)]|nr:hypothetical protein [Candidatus Thiodiazotropha sp. (ex Notomyrtea botanica)]